MINKLYDMDVELSVIGCFLNWYREDEKLAPAIDSISESDFHFPENKAIFEAIKDSHAKGESIDLALIGSKLPNEYRQSLFNAINTPSTSAYFNHYLTQLKELSQNRRVRQGLMGLLSGDKVPHLDTLQKLIDSERKNAPIKSHIDKSRGDLQAFIDNIGTEKPRIKFGFSMLDKITGGLRLPSVMMLGAYPSVGKTAFALNIAAKQESPVVFFSLEMSSEMIYERLICAKCMIDYNLFSTMKFTERQNGEIKEAALELKNSPLYILDDIYHIEGQSAVITSIKPKLVIVDYIQKVRTSQKTDSRRTEIDYISGMYKQIAKYNKCAIILLSQISRIDRNEPNMSSLKESGALEADGDYVGILHRPYVLKKNDPEVAPEQAYILIDKNKFGNTGKLDLRFNGRYQSFYELDRYRGSQRSSAAEAPDETEEDLPF